LKYFLVIALLAFLGFLLYRKLRPYLRSLRQIIDTIRQFQSAIVNQKSPDAKTQKLVRCETCGTWVPAGRTLPGSDGRVFCSVECRKAVGSRQ
jgi:hypothetical protein